MLILHFRKGRIIIPLILIIFTGILLSGNRIRKNIHSLPNKSWKAGSAAMVITPEKDLWMEGFAARDKPAHGKLQDLWVKALALEDSMGNRALVITTDIIGYPREISQPVCDRLEKALSLKRSQILLSASHTHSAPVINQNLSGIYPPFEEEMKKNIAEYREIFEDRVVKCAEKAFSDLHPVVISRGTGIARFAVNRRNNKESDFPYTQDPAGPSDYSVPVIKIADTGGNIKVILFGYACHATTLMEYLYSGDYPGFAQADLQKEFPGATAMFFAGCGADQNPVPRGTVPMAEQYGEELTAAVKRVLQEPMKIIAPALETSYREIDLPFSKPYSVEELDTIIANALPYQQRWARDMKNKIENNIPVPASYPWYPVQTWKLGDQDLVALGGEVVVDYAHMIRGKWGNEVIIAGYSNDVMAYIPSVRVLQEGGYEGEVSMQAYGQPSTWKPDIQNLILDEVSRQLTLLNRNKPGN